MGKLLTEKTSRAIWDAMPDEEAIANRDQDALDQFILTVTDLLIDQALEPNDDLD